MRKIKRLIMISFVIIMGATGIDATTNNTVNENAITVEKVKSNSDKIINTLKRKRSNVITQDEFDAVAIKIDKLSTNDLKQVEKVIKSKFTAKERKNLTESDIILDEIYFDNGTVTTYIDGTASLTINESEDLRANNLRAAWTQKRVQSTRYYYNSGVKCHKFYMEGIWEYNGNSVRFKGGFKKSNSRVGILGIYQVKTNTDLTYILSNGTVGKMQYGTMGTAWGTWTYEHRVAVNKNGGYGHTFKNGSGD